jgi:anti-sigma factor RsiW
MLGTPCPTRRQLEEFVLGETSDSAAEWLADHTAKCRSCEAALMVLDDVRDELLVLLRQYRQSKETNSELTSLVRRAARIALENRGAGAVP